MPVFTIDDERPALETLNNAVREAIPSAEIRAFRRAAEALDYMEQHGVKPEIVFSDIRMPGIDGLVLAVRIKTLSPETRIVFVTAYSDYALKAFQVHASGYLVKPVSAAQILEALKYVSPGISAADNRLRVQCFGNFEVFWNGKPVLFKRRKSKELLAYLIDREGAFCYAEEIIAVLWEDETNLRNGKHKLRNLISDLKTSLSGAEGILIRQRDGLAVNRASVNCDYFRMLDGEAEAVNAFRGEYMTQYSWAEMTMSKLHFRENE